MSALDVTLDLLEARDAPLVADVLATGLDEAWTVEGVAGALATGAWGLVARSRDGRALGVLLARSAGDEAEVLQVAVVPDGRRRGLGRRLVRAALSHVAASRGRSAFLEVRPGNAAARALYASEGFLEVGRRPRYYSNGEDAVVMRLDLDFALTAPGWSPGATSG